MGDVDPIKLPGTISERKVLSLDDVSSDEDFGTNVMLKSGKDKKEALKQKQRLQNLRTQAEGTKASDVADAADAPSSASAPSPKRGRNTGCNAAAGTSSDSPTIEESVRMADKEESERKSKRAKEAQRMRAQLDLCDDDDDEPPVRKKVAKARASAASTSRIWLHVECDGRDQVVSCPTNEPLRAGDFVQRVATMHALDPSRVVLRGSEGGPPLDMSRSPVELGLGASNDRIWTEEKVKELLTLKIRCAGEDVLMRISPTESFASLLQRYCAEHGDGTLTPARLHLDFDGEIIAPEKTPDTADIEDGDLIDLKVL